MIGPLPTTNHGNKYIVTMIDYFSKWPDNVKPHFITTAAYRQHHPSIYQYFEPSGPVRFTNKLDEQWMAETKVAGLSAGSTIEVRKKSTSSSTLEVAVIEAGPFLGWGF